jgi:hypothetical protein
MGAGGGVDARGCIVLLGSDPSSFAPEDELEKNEVSLSVKLDTEPVDCTADEAGIKC